MDRQLLKLPFRKGSPPAWRCPSCNAGILNITDGTFYEEELSQSRRDRDHDAWEPEWVQLIYSCMLRCSNTTCQEAASSVGSGSYVAEGGYDSEGRLAENWIAYYEPEFFVPHLKMFAVPANTPADVASAMHESFRLFFCNPSSASNHVRIALELMLNDMKVKRYSTNKGGRKPISLHHRIQLLPQKHDKIKDLCVAAKWLGNAGSHSNGQFTRDDVLDAYEIVQTVLTALYDPKDKSTRDLAKRVNKKKGPVSRSSKGKRKKN